jgi:hypothetical protein
MRITIRGAPTAGPVTVLPQLFLAPVIDQQAICAEPGSIAVTK